MLPALLAAYNGYGFRPVPANHRCTSGAVADRANTGAATLAARASSTRPAGNTASSGSRLGSGVPHPLAQNNK